MRRRNRLDGSNPCDSLDQRILLDASPLFPFASERLLDQLITDNDPTRFSRLVYSGQETVQIYDRRLESSPEGGYRQLPNTFVFNVTFHGDPFGESSTVRFVAHPEYGTVEKAQAAVEKIARHLGRLPSFLITPLAEVEILNSDHLFHGGNRYNRNVTINEKTADLEIVDGEFDEVLFHEATHAAFESVIDLPEWQTAQSQDSTAISTYAQSYPEREDIAETVLVWWGLRYRPDRLTPELKEQVEAAIPNRLAFLDHYAAARGWPGF